MKSCQKCGKEVDRLYSGLCQGCYNYYKNGGTENPLPDKGRIEYDSNGKVVCHICGRAYVRLGSHVRETHHLTIEEYKNEFELCKRSKTTEYNYSKTMSNHALENKMDDQLRVCGAKTRIQKGDKSKRQGKKVCLQEILDKRARGKNV